MTVNKKAKEFVIGTVRLSSAFASVKYSISNYLTTFLLTSLSYKKKELWILPSVAIRTHFKSVDKGGTSYPHTASNIQQKRNCISRRLQQVQQRIDDRPYFALHPRDLRIAEKRAWCLWSLVPGYRRSSHEGRSESPGYADEQEAKNVAPGWWLRSAVVCGSHVGDQVVVPFQVPLTCFRA